MGKTTPLFSNSNLILLCTIEALYHMSLSLLRFFFDMDLFYYTDTVLSSLTIFFAVIYLLKSRPIVHVKKDVFLLLIMLLYLVISCITRTVVSGEDWLTVNSKYIVDLEILIVIYILGKHYAKNGIPTAVMNFFHGMILLWTAVILFLLVNVFSGHLITAPSGATLCTLDPMFFVLNVNRNHTGAYSGVFLLLSLCMLTWCKSKTIRVFYYPAILINYVLLIISCSKTALLATTAGFAFIIGLMVYYNWKDPASKKRLPVSILAGLISGTVFFILRYTTTETCAAIVEELSGENLGAGELAIREIFDGSSATLSGRLPIWKISIDIIFTMRFLLSGVTPYGIFKDIADAMGQEPWGLNTHNQFLEIGTTMGLPALIAFIIWTVLIVIASWKVFAVKKEKLNILLLPMLLIAFSVMSMAEAYLMFYEHFVAYVFFFICGIIYTKSDLKLKPLFTIDLSKIK